MDVVRIHGGHQWRNALQKYLRAPGLRVGILEGATNTETGEKIAPYAAKNEYGAPGIPSRPFMRATVDAKQNIWPKNIAASLRAGRDIMQAIELVGTRMADDIQETIKSSMPPPNSPETLLRKRADVAGKGTLIDTSSMLLAIDYEVTRT